MEYDIIPKATFSREHLAELYKIEGKFGQVIHKNFPNSRRRIAWDSIEVYDENQSLPRTPEILKLTFINVQSHAVKPLDNLIKRLLK